MDEDYLNDIWDKIQHKEYIIDDYASAYWSESSQPAVIAGNSIVCNPIYVNPNVAYISPTLSHSITNVVNISDKLPDATKLFIEKHIDLINNSAWEDWEAIANDLNAGDVANMCNFFLVLQEANIPHPLKIELNRASCKVTLA